MARIGLWSDTIESSAITSLYNSGKGKSYSDLTDDEKVGLVSYWNLDEVSGVRYDSHGANDLTDNNTVGSTTNSYPANMPGVVANFVAASSEYLSRADSATTVWGEDGLGVSWAFWFKQDTAPSGYGLYFGRNDAGAGRTFEMFADTGTYTNPFMRVDAGGAVQTQVTLAYSNTWRLAVVTFDPADKKQRLYVDDTLISTSGATSSASLTASAAAIAIGGWPAIGGYFNGLMSSHMVWNRTLTAQERTDLYNAGAGLFYED